MEIRVDLYARRILPAGDHRHIRGSEKYRGHAPRSHKTTRSRIALIVSLPFSIRYVQGAIEDLAFMIRSSRESDGKKAEDGDVVLSTTLPNDQR